MKPSEPHLTSIPPTPGEVAVAAAQWERRGMFARLVRIDDPEPDTDVDQFRPAA